MVPTSPWTVAVSVVIAVTLVIAAIVKEPPGTRAGALTSATTTVAQSVTPK